MARERTIPSPATYMQDFGLNVTPVPVNRNKRVVIIGTSEDGPMYEPIEVSKPEDAELVWGRNGVGDLVRGIFECWDVQPGSPTVVGVRIGNGEQAVLEIDESSGTNQYAAQTTATTSLKLEAKYPGQIYNQITIGYDDNRKIAIYNPKTGLTTTFSVDTDHPTNPSVDVHNVSELVDAINADRNLSSVLQASYSGLISDYEVAISGTSTGVNAQTNKVSVNLYNVLNAGYVTTNGFIIDEPVGTGVTSANNIIALETVEAVSISEWEKLECKGKTINNLKISPLDGKGTSEWDTIQAMYDYNADNEYIQDPSGNIVSEFIYSIENAMVILGDTGTPSGGFIVSGVASNCLRLETPICLDDSEMSGEIDGAKTGIASGYIIGLRATTYLDYFSSSGSVAGWDKATCQYIATKVVDGYNVRPSGLITVQVSDGSDPNGYWQTLPYDTTSGIYLKSYTAQNGTLSGETQSYGVAEFGVGAQASGNAIMRSLVDSTGKIMEGKYVRVSANTVKGSLGEVENFNALYPDSVTPFTQVTNYFVRGQEIIFNTPPPYNMIINYGTRITYEPGSTVNLEDAANGVVSWSTPDLLPGPGGDTLSNTKVSYIRFRYTYMPNFPQITSAAKSLSGGTSGKDLNGLQRYNEFDKAYNALRNYQAHIWVPMGAFIDATTTRFNPLTGLKEVVNVGYHIQLEDFLEDLSINSIQPHAILGVTPMTKVTQGNKDTWVTRLTVQDFNDPTRGANVMNQIQNKFISVVAFEPVILNIGRGRPYTTNGQAVYAGQIASMPYNISPTNKPVQGIDSIRFELAISQYEALNDSRYVMMKPGPGRRPVIVEDKTAAPFGSDYVNWVIFCITAEACNRVRAIAESFIGKPNSIEVRASMEQMISNELISMDGLRQFDFSTTSTPTQQVLGIIEVDLILVPIFTIKKIRTTVKLRKNLPSA